MGKNANKSIVLVGMMGSGKSVTGKKLSAKIGLPFIDSDSVIETDEELPITDIFEKFGEAHFRKKEAQTIEKILQGKPCVLSCGGGAFCHAPTRDLCKKFATSIFLSVPTRVLWARIKDHSHRPLVKNGLKAFEGLLRTRQNDYQQADIIIDCKGKSFTKIINEIVKQISA